ncbi:MAG TPA: GtrA family protein [Elusimicrobiales bacterium]|nr:GtrA family protein [Elusimicrobiales bacterium]HOL62819.1 GtrA family protein [Elusimicrobiales bacterium]HPO95745.1 GtrA family protein [Elusimicrobiales bacterium]
MDKTIIQFFKYLLIGGSAFLIDYSLLWILTERFNFFYLISSAISFICGLIFNYLLSVRWVFDKRKLRNKKLEFLFFSVIGIAGLFINQLSIWFFTEKLKIFYMYSKLLSSAIVLLWNFGARKFFLF